MPDLAPLWARASGTSPALLVKGSSQALNAVRTTASRRPDKLIETFVAFALATLDPVDDPEVDDPALELCRRVHVAAGPAATALFVRAVIESGSSYAERLVELGDGRLAGLTPQAPPVEREKVQQRNEHAQGGAVVGTDPKPLMQLDLSTLQARCQVLMAQTDDVGPALEDAARRVAQGYLVEDAKTRLESWSGLVQALLVEVEPLGAATGLRECEQLIQAAQEQEHQDRAHLDETHSAVNQLLQAGLEAPAMDLLRARGFDDLQELQLVIGEWHSRQASVDHQGATSVDETAGDQAGDGAMKMRMTTASEATPEVMREPSTISVPNMVNNSHNGNGHGTGDREPAGAADGPAAAPEVFHHDHTPVQVYVGSPPVAEPISGTSDEGTTSEPAAGAEGLVDPAAQGSDPLSAALGGARSPELPPPGLLGSPWTSPSPSLITRLVSEGRMALALLVARTEREPESRLRMLSLIAASSGVTTASLEQQLPLYLLDDREVGELGADDLRMLLAGSLWASLRVGYAPLSLSRIADTAELPSEMQPHMQSLIDAAVRGYRAQGPSLTGGLVEPEDKLADLGRSAAQVLSTLQNRNIKYARATNIIRHLVKEGQPTLRLLGEVVQCAERGAGTRAEWPIDIELLKVIVGLSDHDARTTLIHEADDAVSTHTQRKKKIEAGALDRLHSDLATAADVAKRFQALLGELGTRGHGSDSDASRVLVSAAVASRTLLNTDTPGTAALGRLFDWISSGGSEPPVTSLDELVQAELLPAWSLVRDADQRPTSPPTDTVLAYLLSDPSVAEVARGYAFVGNLVLARRFAEQVSDGERVPLQDDLARAEATFTATHGKLLSQVDRLAARLRAMHRDELARDVASQTESLLHPFPGRWDDVQPRLRALIEQAEQQLLSDRDSLIERCDALACSPEDRTRILEQIEQGDEPLALEFITAAESGRALPVPEEIQANDYLNFFPAVVQTALGGSRVAEGDTLTAVRRSLGHGDAPTDRVLKAGLDGWRNLRREKRGDQGRFRVAFADVLRMLGLVPATNNWIHEHNRTTRAGYATFKVKASPVGRSYVPSFGTQAHGQYLVTLVWDTVATPGRLLDFIEERDRTSANIILYLNVLSPEQRLDLRLQTLPGRGKGFSPLLVDDAVIGWLSTKQEPGWHLTQRVTLPFTTLIPYTPFAAGEVPDEVFVGRSEERRRIEDPMGSMFLYGGRQLGKSALLRRVERLFSSPSVNGEYPRAGSAAIYIDLKAAQIGEALEPSELWPLLAQKLRDTGIASPKLGQKAGQAAVTKAVSDWLDLDRANRLLLLLDEADQFLTSDSGQGAPAVNRIEFPVLGGLKSLMESSGRRFKPIFAGLHQVQRFHDSANTPIAHGGQDILIGPLASPDAYALVAEPLTALGYEFESPELVWRLLLFTNYQASLVQIVCEALVKHMRARRIDTADHRRILITREDVETVHGDSEVRGLIAQRFRWTINLDPRYRVIALAVSLRSMDAAPGETFDQLDLREECQTFWPSGFDVISDAEFQRYLNELVGLGVLYQQGDSYGLRSPNIVGMLGTRESLNRELDQADRLLDLPLEYNATLNRRVLGDAISPDARRSPLNDNELARLVPLSLDDAPGGVRFVVGSRALGLDRIAEALDVLCRGRNVELHILDPQGLERRISELSRGRAHLLVDLSAAGADPQVLRRAVASMSRARRSTATICLGPASLQHLEGVAESQVVRLSRWSVEGLRAWYESPFDGPDLRRRLHRVTSGWPEVVESAMRFCLSGKSPEEALAMCTQLLSDYDFAKRLVDETGVGQTIATRWVNWLSRTGEDGLVEAAPATLADLDTALETSAEPIVDRLAHLDVVRSTRDGWVLDRAVVAAAVALGD